VVLRRKDDETNVQGGTEDSILESMEHPIPIIGSKLPRGYQPFYSLKLCEVEIAAFEGQKA
jgi:hypothetical protein